MDTTEKTFETIADEISRRHDHVERGKMMSSPGIKYKDKVFAFFWKDAMVFKLGKNFDPDSVGLEEWEHLNPFKNKGPMRAWYVVPEMQRDHWLELTRLALEYIKTEVK